MTNIGLASAAVAIVPRHVLGRGFVAPSDTFNVACIGVGGRGRSVMTNLASQNIVAMCDIDWAYADKGFAGMDTDMASLKRRLVDANIVEIRRPPSARGESEVPVETRPMTPLERSRAEAQLERMKQLKGERLPKAKRYEDYREMLERQKDIDGVVVATPDHLHATIALAAMDLIPLRT